MLKRLAVNAKVATVLGSIPASSDTVEFEFELSIFAAIFPGIIVVVLL
jgi:hypothetical protein